MLCLHVFLQTWTQLKTPTTTLVWTCILPSDVVDDGVFGQATLNIELLIYWSMFSFHMVLQTCLPLESCTTVLTRTDQPLQRSVLHANVHREISFVSIHGVAIFLWAHKSFVFVGHIIVFDEIAVRTRHETTAEDRAWHLTMNSFHMSAKLISISEIHLTPSQGAAYTSRQGRRR